MSPKIGKSKPPGYDASDTPAAPPPTPSPATPGPSLDRSDQPRSERPHRPSVDPGFPASDTGVRTAVSHASSATSLSVANPAMPALSYPDLQQLTSRHLKEFKVTQDEVYWLASQIIAKDPRFQYYMTEIPPEVQPPSERRQKSLFKQKQLTHLLTQDLVGLVRRPTDRVGQNGAIYVQRCGQMLTRPSGSMELAPDTTLSSIAVKNDQKMGNEYMLFYNANLASVVEGTRTICGRSGRTDTARKLEELLVFNALSSLSAAKGDFSKATGFHTDPYSNTPYFRMALTTAMDLSPLKSFANQLLPQGEDERQFIANIEESIQNLFQNRQSITRSVLHQGKALELTIARPLLFNITMSGQSNTPRNIDAHRVFNRPTGLDLALQLFSQWIQESDGRRSIAQMLTNAHIGKGPSLEEDTFWNSPMIQATRLTLSPKQQLVLDALQVIFTGHDSAGTSLRQPRDPGKEFILLSHLLDETNIALSAQCKSGQDRTLTLTALRVACAAFEHERNAPFDPRLPPDHPDVIRFRELFTESANQFGQNMVKLVRGYDSKTGRAKWDSHQVPRQWYNKDQDPTHPLGDFSNAWA